MAEFWCAAPVFRPGHDMVIIRTIITCTMMIVLDMYISWHIYIWCHANEHTCDICFPLLSREPYMLAYACVGWCEYALTTYYAQCDKIVIVWPSPYTFNPPQWTNGEMQARKNVVQHANLWCHGLFGDANNILACLTLSGSSISSAVIAFEVDLLRGAPSSSVYVCQIHFLLVTEWEPIPKRDGVAHLLFFFLCSPVEWFTNVM